MKSECKRISELIEAGAWLDASAEGFREVAEHALACPACADVLRELRGVENQLGGELRRFDPGAGFAARVLRGIERRRRAPLLVWAGVAAAAAAVLLALLPSLLAPASGLRPVRVLGGFARADGGRIGRTMPVGAELVPAQPKTAFEVVRGVGFALRPETAFVIDPVSVTGYTRLALRRGGAAISVKTDRAGAGDKVEVVVGGFSLLTNDADFLIETQGPGHPPALYVDRGRVIVAFAEGVSAVESGEQLELVAAPLLSRARSGESRIAEDLAGLQAQCTELRTQIARYEDMVQTYAIRRNGRNNELVLAQESLALAPDTETARKIEQRISQETNAVENLDFVLGEHIAKMTELRTELPKRLNELREKQTMVTRQREECRRGLALLAELR